MLVGLKIDKWMVVASVGGGFSEEDRAQWMEKLKPYEVEGDYVMKSSQKQTCLPLDQTRNCHPNQMYRNLLQKVCNRRDSKDIAIRRESFGYTFLSKKPESAWFLLFFN